MRDYEVIIVGCGPAGNTLAYLLARKGKAVLLIEKETLPRVKVCGGGLSRKTLTELPYSLAPVLDNKIDSALLAQGNHEVVFTNLPDVGATVQRDVMDDFMTTKAVQAGAVLEQGCCFERYDTTSSIRVHTNRGEFRTRILVGADGVYSRVRQQVYRNQRVRLVPAIEALVFPAESALEALGSRALFDVGAVSGGYGWIFPKKDHFNVGLYRYIKRPDNRNLKAGLMCWLKDHPITRNYHDVHVRAHSIPVRPPGETLAKDNVLLIGDAAGLAEGFYGEGIYHALMSARFASETILGYLEQRRSISEYDRKLRPLRFNLLVSRVTADIFYRLSPRVTGKMLRSRRVSDFFGGLITGKMSASRCFLYTAGLAPLWFLESGAPHQTVDSLLFSTRRSQP